jgi:predicted DNA-binding protein (MmcQ/YjbR family)
VTLEQFNAYCATLPHATHVIQWGGAHVWKVAGKVFAIAGWSEGRALAVTFKCTPMSFEVLRDRPGCRPAPYLASRGMPWIQRTSAATLKDAALRAYLLESHRLAAATLTKKARLALGLQ